MSQGSDKPSVVGRPCWWDLVCGDVAGAQAAMTQLLGWRVEGLPMGDEVYPMAGREGECWGGFVELPPGRDLPDHWLPYLAVADLDAACAAVLAGGGTVLTGTEEGPGSGRYCVCEGPDGSWFTVHSQAEITPPWPEPPGRPGAPWGGVLATPDPEQSARFYRSLMNWGIRDAEDGLQILLPNGTPLAVRISTMPEPDLLLEADFDADTRARWLPCFAHGDNAELLIEAGDLVTGGWPGNDAICLAGAGLPPFLVRELP